MVKDLDEGRIRAPAVRQDIDDPFAHEPREAILEHGRFRLRDSDVYKVRRMGEE